jgi:hypothetical protein
LTLTAGTGISAVSGEGIYLDGATANIDATVMTPNYIWGSWTGISPGTVKATEFVVTATTTLTANAVAVYTATVDAELDGDPWDDGSEPEFTLVKDDDINETELPNGSYVVPGTYMIYADGVDTGETIVIGTAANTKTLDYFTPDTEDLPTVIIPKDGETPDDGSGLSTSEYTVSITWTPDDDPFLDNTVYTATFTLTANTGYTFAGMSNSDVITCFTLGDIMPTDIVNCGTTLEFKLVFPVTICMDDIFNIAPTAGGPAVTTINATQYTATVSWSPELLADDEFGYFTEYEATITITPKEGYTLTGVLSTFFTVTGSATMSYAAGSDTITATFDATAKQAVVAAAIEDVTSPVAGATPSTTISDGIGFTSVISWIDSPTAFDHNREYKATITLTAETGYTFSSFTTASSVSGFTVNGIAPVRISGDADELVLEVTFHITAKKVIDMPGILGITAPKTGDTRPTTITPTAQYTGTISWSPSAGTTFASGMLYTATITLTPTADCTLTGVSADFFTVAGADTVSNGADSGVITVTFLRTDTTILATNLPNFAAPSTGGATARPITPTAQYTGSVSWSPSVGTTFNENTAYKATITLNAASGYTFTGLTSVAGITIGGVTPTIVSNDGDELVLEVSYSATAKTIPPSAATITGITAPATGSSPTYPMITETEYTGAVVSWSPDIPAGGTFAPGVSYTATINITPTEGYTLTGMAANPFAVTGASSVTYEGNGVVKATFPATALKALDPAVISVPAPVTGAQPVRTIADTAQYSATIEWSPNIPTNGTFAPGTEYTAKITITPKTGYTLTGVPANDFTVSSLPGAGNAANSGVITAVFSATATLPINTSAPVPGISAPSARSTATTSIDTPQYTATVAWSPAVSGGVFEPGVNYTATITITPKAGYTLTGVAANSFVVPGASSVTHAAGSGVITATFPSFTESSSSSFGNFFDEMDPILIVALFAIPIIVIAGVGYYVVKKRKGGE